MTAAARRVLLAFAAAAAACQCVPRDDFGGGQEALAAGNLAAALRRFDAVPVSDLHYPEARLAAAALERRLRRHKELLLLGLRLRGEWRDDDALAAFRGALDAWPDHEETAELIAATEYRLRLVADLERRRAREVVAAAPTEPVGPGAEVPSRSPESASEMASDLPAHLPDGGEVGQSMPSLLESPIVPRSQLPTSDAVGAELAKLEARLASGELEAVLEDLFALHRHSPDDARVGMRLARLLQQRGLMRYGQGQVASAITDWQRAIDLDAELRSAQVMLELAARELASPPR